MKNNVQNMLKIQKKIVKNAKFGEFSNFSI